MIGRYEKLEGQRIIRSQSLDEDPVTYGSINIPTAPPPSRIRSTSSNKSNKVISLPETRESKYLDDDDDNLTDDAKYLDKYNEKLPKTGRQRKKQTTRTKGGEFQSQRKKRRLYFCCVSKEIDIQDLFEHVSLAIAHSNTQWKAKLYGDALCISRVVPKRTSLSVEESSGNSGVGGINHINIIDDNLGTSISTDIGSPNINSVGIGGTLSGASITAGIGIGSLDGGTGGVSGVGIGGGLPPRLSDSYSQEVFVFEFGAVVFWGFNVLEEKHLLDVVRDFSKKILIADNEFISGEDDMAFVISADVSRINIANDVIELPEGTTSKQRLSVSYAIAQSSVVSIFEYRIEKKIAEYKFIPETLAKDGIIDDVSSRRVGMMIGDIFVIRHDLNLHTDILDTPDYFWGEEDIYEEVYERVMKYLEMESRVEVVNKRLDMLKELLDVLHQQMENAHSTKLEWIIIWLIVLEVVIQIVGAVGGIMGIWVW